MAATLIRPVVRWRTHSSNGVMHLVGDTRVNAECGRANASPWRLSDSTSLAPWWSEPTDRPLMRCMRCLALADVEPNGCRHCGVAERVHYRRFTEAFPWQTPGWHNWTAPTDGQRLRRMLVRRAARTGGAR